MCGIMITKDIYQSQMKHRGVFSRQKKIGKLRFIHEHLPIQSTIDVDSIIDTRDHIILFNGELFGLPDGFKDDLEYIEYIWQENTYESGKIQKILDMDGFYSFLIYDKRTGEITAFTDPLGKKQLYYSKDGIASELRGLKKDGMTSDKLFESHTIKFGYVTDDSTPYNEIKRVMPNMVYTFSATLRILNTVGPLERFEPSYHRDLVKPEYMIWSLIGKAVQNRLAGHKKIGLLLSGGLDSSIIYHHVKDLGVDIQTYCVDNEDDLKYARMMDPDVIAIEQGYLNFVDPDDALEAMEMPVDLGSMIAQYDLFAAVKETVILTGDGADEVFGGYRRMKTYDSQYSDIFEELPFYHNIRIDRMSMWHTKEARSPFMSLELIRYMLTLPYRDRINKMVLRNAYRGILPDEIIERGKEALKSNTVRKTDPVEYRSKLVRDWKDL